MKVNLFLIFAFITGSHAHSLAQKVNLKVKNAKLEEVFNHISKQTNLRFLYDSDVIKNADKVSLSASDMTIESALDKVLSKPGFSYKIIATTVSVNYKPVEVGEKEGAKDVVQQNKVRGTVKDTQGRVLSGATVTVEGSSLTTTTNDEGVFEINAAPNATLVVTYVGHRDGSIAVNNKSNLAVVLTEVASEIAGIDVVATGYQTLNRKFFTGAATRVSAKEAERAGVPDISRMLEGQVAGLNLQNVSGTFGAAPKIRIRGATSLSGDNKPLWVVDGIILEDVVNISNEALSTGDMNTLLGSSVAGLNADDIESFSILKDAAATAMYGARAMNGVIVVNTKKGTLTDGKPIVSYTGNFSSYIKPRYSEFDVMTSYDQMAVMIELRNKGFLQIPSASRGSTGGVFYKMYNALYNYDPITNQYGLRHDSKSQSDFLSRYANANTDWFDLLFKSSVVQEHSVSIQSGTEKSQSYSSVSYMNDPGMTLGNNVKRFTGNFRTNYKFNDRFKAELLGNGSIRQQTAPGSQNMESDPVYGSYYRGYDINPYNYALSTSRLITPFDENGKREYFVRDYAPFNILNEIENNYAELSMIDFKVQGGFTYEFLKDLKYSINGAFRYTKTENELFLKEGSNYVQSWRMMDDATVVGSNGRLYKDPDFPNELPVSVLPEGGFYNISSDNLKFYYFRQDLEYDKEFNEDNSINLFATMEMKTTDRQAKFFDGPGYQYENGGLVAPFYKYYKQGREEGKPPYGMGYNNDRWVGYSMRAAYAYKNRYRLNATGRYDGSNKMGKSRTARWLPTWNVSGAWLVDEEDFWPENTYVSTLGLRATYGMVASMGNATNSAAVFYNQIARRREIVDQETLTYLSSLENSELTWEKMKEFNLGIDMTLINNKINLTVDIYDRRNYDLLGSIQTSGIDGQFRKTANYANMKSNGVEVTIAGKPISKNDFHWNTRFNFALNKNKITKLDINPNIWRGVSNTGGAVEGYPQRGLFSIQYDGLNPDYGYPTFIGIDGLKTTYIDLQSQTLDYLKYEGSIEPTFTGGFYNSLNYKGFTLSGLFTFSAGNKLRLKPTISAYYNDMSVMTKDMLNRWIMPGDENKTNIPALLDPLSVTDIRSSTGSQVNVSYPYNAYNYSTERVVNGHYIKLKQVSLGYALPKRWISSAKLNNASFNLVANNLWTILADKRLNGQDPEFFASGGVALPTPRQITLSLKLGF
ncbi:SusC/RagA family TonB-linked outer membrane protein [Sphingobacterium sp. UT-1RO-CII-1]|nr:SusC/RagA family TonB-linked outer membrane protein [Sphingobacterium sp. UT-1RO-CII-1]